MTRGILAIFMITLLLSAVGCHSVVPAGGPASTGAGGAHAGVPSAPIRVADQDLVRLQKLIRAHRKEIRRQVDESASGVITLEEAEVETR